MTVVFWSANKCIFKALFLFVLFGGMPFGVSVSNAQVPEPVHITVNESISLTEPEKVEDDLLAGSVEVEEQVQLTATTDTRSVADVLTESITMGVRVETNLNKPSYEQPLKGNSNAPTGKGSNELFANDVFAKGTGGVLEETDSYGPIVIYIILGLGAIAFLVLLGGALYGSQRNRSTP